MQKETNTKLITCILPKGKAMPLQESLVEKKKLQSGNFHFGRGVGRDFQIKHSGIGEQEEREILEVVVTENDAENIFDFIYQSAEIDKAHAGIIYMTQLHNSTPFEVPKVDD